MRNKLLAAALKYALDLGWAVLPLNGKRPYNRNGVTGATTKEQVIRDWWNQYPDANVGIAGGNPWWGLDIDPRNGGGRILETLIAQHGALPDTPRQDTGGGGQHYLFQMPGVDFTIRSRSGIQPGIDVKCEGGYLVAPPSIHPETGSEYVWDVDLHPCHIPLAPAPTWLLKLVQEPRLGTSPRRKTRSEWQEKLRPRSEGEGRHESLLSLVGLLWHKGRLPRAVIEPLVISFNQTSFDPPLERSEIDRLISFVSRKEGRNARK